MSAEPTTAEMIAWIEAMARNCEFAITHKHAELYWTSPDEARNDTRIALAIAERLRRLEESR